MFSLRTGALLLALGSIGAQAPPTPAPYTVLSAEGRRPLPTRLISGQEMFALDDLTKLFELTVREDTLAGGLTVTARTQSIVLTPGQSLASVGGRLISLPAPPARDGRSWFVPVDFVPRALAAALGTPLELRKPSRLILVGDVRVPRIAGSIEVLGPIARLTLDVAPPTPHTIAQEGTRLIVKFEADALDAALPTPSAPDLMQNIRPGDGASLVIDLGPRFGSFRSSDLPGDRGAGRIVIDLIASDDRASCRRPLHRQRPRRLPRRRSSTSPRPAASGRSSSTPATAAPKMARMAPAARLKNTSRSAWRGG